MPSVLWIRGLSPDARARFTDGANLRGLTFAAYLEKLILLHEALRADAGPDNYADILLRELGLESVTRSG